MKVTHTVTLNAPVDKVWKVLLDPNEIAGCIPGCEGLTPVGNDQYEAVMRVGVGAVRGTFRSKVSLKDITPTTSYRMSVEGQGNAGLVNGEGLISLAPEGAGTLITIDGDANIAGTIAAVGQRMLTGAARMMMNQFFGCIGKKVEGA